MKTIKVLRGITIGFALGILIGWSIDTIQEQDKLQETKRDTVFQQIDTVDYMGDTIVFYSPVVFRRTVRFEQPNDVTN